MAKAINNIGTIKTNVAKKTAAAKGLQTGIVTDLIDSEEEFQVKIILPGMPKNSDSLFARLSSFDAGNNRGAFFMPEIGDEVIVGFINDDPKQLVVLGSLFSKKNPSPIIAGDENRQKGYVSRAQMKLLFDDDRKIFSIQTPAGNIFSINEADNNILLSDTSGNRILMDSNGITVEAAASIVFKAGAQISMQAPAITIKAAA